MKQPAFVIMGEHIFQQGKAMRSNAAIFTLRSGEHSLGVLTPEDKKWLATAFEYLNEVYAKRERGKPGHEGYCLFTIGKFYVQFKASWNSDTLACEAVSAKSIPALATVLTPKSDEILHKYGLEPPELFSPNYSQTIKIDSAADIGYAVRLAYRVFKEVYKVTDFSSTKFVGAIPKEST